VRRLHLELCADGDVRAQVAVPHHPHAAEDLLQTTLTKVYVGWRRMRAADDPVPYAHGILVKSFLSERRLRRSGELPRRSSVPTAATSRSTSEKVRVPTGPIPSTTLPTYRR